MSEFALPVVVALAVWFLGTGIVMLLDGMPRDTHRWSVASSTLLAGAALICIDRSAGDLSVGGAYAAFSSAVLVWGWHELTFLTGWLTGPRRIACSAPERRFGEAVAAILWHELAIIATAAAIAVLTLGEPNQVATWTFVLLWAMRLSAKLNLYLGVRNLGVEFLPPHLRYLQSYFRRARMNALLPVSVLGGAAVVAALAAQAAATTGGERTGLLLLAALLALAVFEHLLLVLPVDAVAPWRWALRGSLRDAEPRPREALP